MKREQPARTGKQYQKDQDSQEKEKENGIKPMTN